MKIIKVAKAEPILSDGMVEGVTIEVSEAIPEFQSTFSMTEVEMFYKKEAKAIYEAMYENLPQGTRYQLLLLMLEAAPNLYRGR